MRRPSTLLLNICLPLLVLTACSAQSGEEKGKEIAAEKVDTATEVGDALQEKGGAAADSIATGLSSVLKEVERGVKKSQRTVELCDGAKQVGLQVTKVMLSPDKNASPAPDARLAEQPLL